MNDLQIRNRVIALAGVFQAASLVQQVARHGAADTDAFQASIGSIFKIDAESVEAVFGGRNGITLGLNVLCRQLGKAKHQRDLELTRYAISLLFLERKLAKRPDYLGRIREDVQRTMEQAAHFSATHENVVSGLAELYSNTLSTLSPRIMVSGEPEHLQDPNNTDMIRALLLAGIRAAVLWRQSGGNRLRLLLSRGRIVAYAQKMLSKAAV